MNAYETEAPEPLLNIDHQLCFAVYSAEHAFARAYKPLLAELGITYPQYLVMMILWEGKPLTVNEIGMRVGLDSGTLSPLLKRLEAAGYVQRKRAEEDERRVTVALTAKGNAAKKNAREVARSIAVKTGCSLEEARTLLAELNALRRRLSAAVEED
ncbi:MarR family winged helix-turn-helix transcriptional regulator [Martelella endophytica]|uniref:MarR family transcriptional regulator n=1 Tax=Martelella endophytica TaxID=1486262 RepID=A0A0D5LVS0_MAREN|nr:MarR family transcriptional regulator [Martelella endophytica]AJY47478.1 MarR family transcriptional regulator [Martelella endophytica]